MCLCETWLNENINTKELIFKGFKVYRYDRICKRGGGLSLLVKNSIESSFQDSLQNDYIEVLHISYDNQFFFLKHIIMIYRPPNSSLARFFAQLDIILDKCDLNQNFLIMGDFNIDCNNKSLNSRKLIILMVSDYKTQRPLMILCIALRPSI